MLELINEIHSPSKEYKVEINKRLSDKLLEIDVYCWDSEWETWIQNSTGFSLTDSLDNALEIAKEKLKAFSGETME